MCSSDLLAIAAEFHAANLDSALEYCEDALLQAEAPYISTGDTTAELGDFEILAKLDPSERRILGDRLVRRDFDPDETIVKIGTDADALYLFHATPFMTSEMVRLLRFNKMMW